MRLATGQFAKKVQLALAWRIRRVFGDERVDRTLVRLAHLWRPYLKKPLFIGVTGSAGKTTTKELIVGILSASGRGTGNPASLNVLPEVAKTVLRIRRNDDFCVAELSGHSPGQLDAPLTLFQPQIGIVTAVANDHWSAYNSLEEIAKEKVKLVASLPASGTAVLNADDKLVKAMAQHCRANVITYGTSADAHLRASNIDSTWPDRLAFDATYQGQRVRIQTQLCGEHWLAAVLGALGGAMAAGMSLTACAQSIANVPAFTGRMQPVCTKDGVTFIRDDFKAPLWTVDACLQFMRKARAQRKIVVIGMLSDGGSGSAAKYANVAKQAQEIADIVVFIGPWASHVLKARKAGEQTELHVFSRVFDAARFLRVTARAGDLVLLKGTNKQDHLQRLVLDRSNEIACWQDACKRDDFCTDCPHRMKASGVPKPLPASESGAAPAHHAPRPPIAPNEQVIVGLGNADEKFAGTPHNVGFAALDHLASKLALQWKVHTDAWIARGMAGESPVCLVKLRSSMNLTGEKLKPLAHELSISPAQCILVYDELDLPLGVVRTKMGGGAAGHRGMVSVLEAFQTDRFRRVKIGVGQDTGTLPRLEYVLRPFDAEVRSTVDKSVESAAQRALELVIHQAKAQKPASA
jgi:UDP-N-acetylmuramoyl-tripeptide--D-alanyl-D-alanine ligase